MHIEVALFADGKSLFSVVDNIDESIFKLNKDLISIQDWVNKWTFSFRGKPAQEVKFSRRNKNITYPNLYIKNQAIFVTTFQNKLDLHLDARFTVSDHKNNKNGTAMKGIGPQTVIFFTTFQSAIYLQILL